MSAEIRRFECNESEARTLTEDIRRGVERVHLLLVRSYEWGAWRALGYVSWRDYAMTEFGMSKSRAYELLDQARVIKAIEGAAGSGIPEINAGQAAELAPIVREHGPEAAAAVLSAVVDSGAKPTAAEREHNMAKQVASTIEFRDDIAATLNGWLDEYGSIPKAIKAGAVEFVEPEEDVESA